MCVLYQSFYMDNISQDFSTCKSAPRGVITCKAAVAWKPSEPLVVEDIQVDPPKSTEVRMKMLYASMCHTDASFWKGYYQSLFPRVLGHEGIGVIESVGDKVRNLKVGDIVMPLYLRECGECANCRSGKTNVCNVYPLNLSGLMEDGTSRMSFKGQKLYHLFSCSTWSEYAVIESSFAVKVNPNISLPHASLLCCGFTTGYGAAWKELKVEKGSTVAILGLGSVGLGAAKACNILGATRVFGVDVNEVRREKAKTLGVTDFINPKHYDKTTPELIREATGGLGVDYCFECTGVQSLLNEAMESTKKGVGQTAFVSGAVKKMGELNFALLSQGRTIKGTYFGGVKVHSDLHVIVEKCVNKEIDLEELITHEVSLAEINKGFLEYTKEPDCIKVIIKF